MVNFASLLAPTRKTHKVKTVEDVVRIVGHHIYDGKLTEALGDIWFNNFLNNVLRWVEDDKPLTTEQARIVLKILEKTREVLVADYGIPPNDIEALLRSPVYVNQPTKSAMIPREARWAGNDLLALRFKRNDIIIQEIKSMSPDVIWDHRQRIWLVPVTSETIQPIVDLIAKHRFQFDDATETFLLESGQTANGVSGFAYDAARGVVLARVSDNDLLSKWVWSALGGRLV